MKSIYIFLLFWGGCVVRAYAQPGCPMLHGSFTYEIAPNGFSVSFSADLGCFGDAIVSWDFDDGAVEGDVKNPVHVFSEDGTYLVSMKMTLPAPCNQSNVFYIYSQWINITGSNPGIIFAEITGPTIAAECQELNYSATVQGGVPPYRYDWDMGTSYSTNCPISSCDPAANCTSNCCTIEHGASSVSGRFIGTGLSYNTVTVTVTDAIGQYYIASIQTKVKDNVFPLEFFINGSNCGNGYQPNTLMTFSPDINPMSAFSPPIAYTWRITDPAGNVSVSHDDGYDGTGGLLIKSFTIGGTYQVSLTVKDQNGAMQANGNFNICGSTGGGVPNCYIEGGFGHYTYSSGSSTTFVPQWSTNSSCNGESPTVLYTITPKDCSYPAFVLPSNQSGRQISFDFSDPDSDWNIKTEGNRPWGYFDLEYQATIASGSCCTSFPEKKIYIAPDYFYMDDIVLTGSCQDYIASVQVSGGGWKWINGAKQYKNDYTWTAMDARTLEELSNVLLDIPGDPANGPRKRINPDFFMNFSGNQYVDLMIKVVARDYAGQETHNFTTFTFNPFRIAMKDKYYRCPNSVSTFDLNPPLAVGGTENYTYAWSGGLIGENPIFTAPTNGSTVYTVTVTDGGNCTMTASTTVHVRPLANLPAANVKSCSGNGSQDIGPSIESLQGSGSFTYLWSSTNPVHMNFLSSRFVRKPKVTGLVGTATYILKVTDEYGGCSATYTYNVTGVPNTMTLVLPPTVQTCYGTPTTLNVGVNNSRDLPPGYSAKWLYPNFPRNIPLNSTLSGGMFINEQAAHSAGTYPFSVTVTEAETGCQVSGVTNLTILDKWRYTGYKSDPATRFSVLGEAVPLWKDEYQNISDGILLSPSISNPLITWSGPTPTNISVSNNIPSNGTFQPSEEHPKLVMTVVDQSTGCSQKFASTHYILMRKKPVINIKLDNYVICSGSVEGKKIKVQFDPHIIGLPPTNMPLYVILSGIGNVYSNFSNNLGGYIKLNLSGVSGIYEAELKLKDMPPGRHLLSFTYSGFLNNQMWGYDDINATAEVMVVENQEYLPATVKCDFYPLEIDVINRESVSLFRDCPPSPIGPNYSKRGDVSASKFIWISNTNDASIEEFYTMPTSAKRGVHFYINQCLTPPPPGFTNPPTEERTSITILPEEQPELALSIVPTPFQTEVNIQFAFEEKEAQAVDLELYDVTGRKIALLRQWTGLEPGAYNETINMEAYSPGMYTYVLRLSNGKQISRQSIKI